MHKPNENLLDKNWLHNEYVVKQLSLRSIANNIGVTTVVVSKYVKRYGFEIRSGGLAKTLTAKQSSSKNTLLADKDWLYTKYMVEKLGLREIAKLCDDYRRNVKKSLKFFGIPIRDLKDARSSRSAKGPEFRKTVNPLANDISHIEAEYESGKSITTLSDELGISMDAIRHRMRNSGISIREPWEHRIGTQHSIETKLKMSETATKQFTDGTRSSYSNSQRASVLFPDGSFKRVRSSYEKHYIEYLKTNNIVFEYEKASFDLGDGTSYVPDFYLPETNEYVEIKGYLSEDQNIKYSKFKKTYPDIKWRILFKHDLVALGLEPEPFKDIYMVCGVSGSGKSWICNQLTDMYAYISFDGVAKSKHLEALRGTKGPILYDPNIKISTFIRRHSSEFNIIPIFIIEEESIIESRLKIRGGKLTKSTPKRMKVIIARNKKYGVFSGTSDEVLKYLKHRVDLSQV